MPDRIYLSPPHLCGTERDYLLEALESNYIAPLGPMVDGFEQDFSQACGRPHCAAVSSGTAALHLALRVLGVGKGDTVLASTFTFIGGVSPITYLGAKPVFIDSDSTSWNMDPQLLADALQTLSAEGVMPAACVATDICGQCADYDALLAVLAPYDIPLVIDAAESLGASYKGKPAGHAGSIATFSFNGNKIITSSGGGMLAADNVQLIEKARWLAQQAREPLPYYEHEEVGYNYRMSNVVAALGRAQLGALAQRVRRKREIFAAYQTALGDLPLSFMPEAPYGTCTRWLTIMMLDSDCETSPEDIRQALEAHNIESRPVWNPMHRQPVFHSSRVFGGSVSEYLFSRGLCLPSGTAMTEDDMFRICSVIRQSLATK